MKLSSQWSLRSAGLAIVSAAVLWALPYGGRAQEYPSPNRDIRFIAAFPAGSGADVLVRYFAEKARPIVKRTIVVENRVGAGGNIAFESVARSKPDGYTIFVHAPSAVAANQHLFKKPPADAATSILVAGTINRQPFMLGVDVKSPYKTVAELTAAMKLKGAKATYATSAPTAKVMGEIYKQITGIQAVEVNYRTGADSLNELASGRLDYGMYDPVLALAQQREGRMRLLAVSTGVRLEANPTLPTMTESGIPMDLTGWWGAMVPAGTPRPIIDTINKWFVEMVKSPETKKFLNSFGGDPYIDTPEGAQARFLRDIKAWGEYIRIAKIEPQ